MLARQHAGLAVIDQQEIPTADGSQKLISRLRDPIVHRVAAGEAQAVHLLLDAALQIGLYVAKEEVRLLLVGGGQLRVEFRENIQIRAERGALIHVRRINAGPEKGFSAYVLETIQVNGLTGQQ